MTDCWRLREDCVILSCLGQTPNFNFFDFDNNKPKDYIFSFENNIKIIDSDKKVTFDLQSQEDIPIQETIFNNDTNFSKNESSNIKLEVNDIFSKLKKKTLPIRVDNDDDTERKWNIEELINKKEFEILLENQEKIIEFCKSIIEKLN